MTTKPAPLHFDFLPYAGEGDIVTEEENSAPDYFEVERFEGQRYATDLMEQGIRVANTLSPLALRTAETGEL